MDFTIADELKQIKTLAHDFVCEEIIPRENDLRLTGEPDPGVIQKMKELGFYGLTIPEQYGGLGIGVLGYTLAMEELGKAPKAFIHDLILSNGIGSRTILNDGSEVQKQKYLPPIATGQKLCAFALTEPNAGSDAASIQTTAKKEDNVYLLNGTKHFITNGARAGILTVLAVTDRERGTRGGITAFIVEAGTPGFRVAQLQETMAGSPVVQAELVFEDCPVPQENVIGEVGAGFQSAMKTLDEGRLQYGAISLGLAQRLLEMSVDYAKQRVQFGKPIAKQQAIQFMVADMATEIYAARMMLYNASYRYDQGEKVPLEAAMVKLFNTEMVNRVADKAVQIFGGMGYMRELAIERIYREVRIMRIVEGTSEIQRLVIGRKLLKD